MDGEYFSRRRRDAGADRVQRAFLRERADDESAVVTRFGRRTVEPAVRELRHVTGRRPDHTRARPSRSGAGTWWVSVQARLDYGSSTDTRQWFWHHRSVQTYQGAVWQNAGDLLHMSCPSWSRRGVCQAGSAAVPDEMFRLHGTAAPATGPPPPPPPPPQTRCRVPRVVGRTLGRAATMILRAHCRVGRVARRRSVRRRRGKVLAQSPRAGTALVLGARVKLVVGRR